MSNRKVYTIDATGKILGRLAAEISILLQGKHKASYSPHLNLGDEVMVINTSKIKITGKKNEQKKYYRHSGYLGGIKAVIYKDEFKKNPNRVLRKAIYGMLPDNKLRIKMMRRLKLYKEGQYDNKI